MIKNGFLHRALREYKYVTRRKWGYDEVACHWDETAPDYDGINSRAYPYSRRFSDSFDLCAIPDNSRILDICSRTGEGTVYFAGRGKVRSSVCADVSVKMLEICRKKLKESGINFSTSAFGKLPLPFQDGEFDAVLCFETVEHMPEPDKFMKELARVVKTGGEVILTTPNILWEPGHWFVAVFNLHHSEGPHRFLRRRVLLRLAREAGLSVDKERTCVLISFGPKWANLMDKLLERMLPERVLRLLALRRTFIFRKMPG